MKKTASKRQIRTAIMGGSFDPFHLAHLNSLLTVKEKFNLDYVLLIPSFKTPLKHETIEINPFHRLNMLKQVAENYPFLLVDDQEINRKGVSYTYKTVGELLKKRKQEELFFIIGLDQFYIFDQWKNYERILQKTDLIVTSRPRAQFPKRLSDLPLGLKALVKTRKSDHIVLKPVKDLSKRKNKTIYFCKLKDMDISSSDIKKRLLEGKEFSHLLPKEVDLYIKENKLYTAQAKAPDHTRVLMEFSVKELKKKKAYDIKFYDFRNKPLPFSFAVIAIASNTRQTVAIANHLKKTIKERFDLAPWSEEGKESAKWIVLDYGDLIFHIFYDYTRKFYNLEKLWQSCLMDS
ncbi:MAG: nicotinate (nicotinamide) nucleotide adenylyltransferase [Oligoflexia bacterium]|nr:nicotinate (nicotinamide) nucleotide adenylyltransferase [Oligoflexia bacterium]